MFANLSKEQQQKELQRKKAIITSGYVFLKLVLTDDRKIRTRFSAIDSLRATKVADGWKFTEISEQMRFDPDPYSLGENTAYVLYTPKNIDFLASHDDHAWWEVVDVLRKKKRRGEKDSGPKITLDSVLDEIDKRRDILAKEYKDYIDNLPPYKEPGGLENIRNYDDEELLKELARRKKIEDERLLLYEDKPKERTVVEKESMIETGEEKKEEKKETKRKRRKRDEVESESPQPSVLMKTGVGVNQPT